MADILVGDKVAGAKTYPNPKNVSPRADTDPPGTAESIMVKPIPTSVPTHIFSNKNTTAVAPRHQLGRGIPKSHPAAKTYEF